jgi:hypothetical protein
MTVAEFILWLQTQDQEAIVEVVYHSSNGGGYYSQGGTARTDVFTPEASTYTDFRGNPFMKGDEPHANKRFLLLGEHNG